MLPKFWFLSLQLFLIQQSQSANASGNHQSSKSIEIVSAPRIIGGHEAREGEIPGIISLQTWRGDHTCGGTWFTLGNQSQILTAAHCVLDSETNRIIPRKVLQVMGDDLSISPTSASPRRQVRQISKIVPHPYYNPKTLANDIAVIFLTSQFDKTKTFAPAALTNRRIYDNQQCIVAGWGYLGEIGPIARHLMVTNVSVVPWDKCNGPFSYNGKIGRHAFCAGAVGADSCRGDSGGGIYSDNQLVGLVSFGVGCGNELFPGVYTNVHHYIHWIRQVINSSPGISQLHISMLITVAAIHFIRTMF